MRTAPHGDSVAFSQILQRLPKDQWDARVTINGDAIKAMTAYSYFGDSQAPKGFIVALLDEDRSEFLIFQDADKDWLEFSDYTYRKCNQGHAMKFGSASASINSDDIGTPRDYSESLHRYYFEMPDPKWPLIYS